MASENKSKILIVEDHQEMFTVLKRYLEDQEYEVLWANSGEVAIKMFEEEEPDLVLMDIMLPGMSGIEAIQKIKVITKEERYIPVIIITAKNDINDIVSGLNSGADDYLVKPFHFDELIARIKSALRLKSLNELLISQSKNLEGANKEISGLNKTLLDKNRELRKNIYGLHSIFEVSMEISSILELERLSDNTILTLMGLYSCKSAVFFLADPKDTDKIIIYKQRGLYDEESEQEIVIEKNDELIKYLQAHPNPFLLKDFKKHFTNSKAYNKLESLGITLLTSLLINHSLEGLLCLGPRIKKTDFEDREIQQISILSNIISIAVNNASLYKEVEQLSYTDGMTHLHNYRYFEMRLKEEIIRHNRTKSGLSLLILDVDFFKNFNDTLGHQAGDEVLKKLGEILTETVRENDIVARYGGEEFAIILPAVEKEGALILAERIRKKVEETPFEGAHVQPHGKITISMGEASLPEDSDNFTDLINKADEALYQAKRGGRNRVKTYAESVAEKK